MTAGVAIDPVIAVTTAVTGAWVDRDADAIAVTIAVTGTATDRDVAAEAITAAVIGLGVTGMSMIAGDAGESCSSSSSVGPLLSAGGDGERRVGDGPANGSDWLESEMYSSERRRADRRVGDDDADAEALLTYATAASSGGGTTTTAGGERR